MTTAKPLCVWTIEDDEIFRRQHGELIPDWFPGTTVETFETTMQAWKAVGSPAVIVLDLGSVYGGHFGGGSIEGYVMHAENVARKHPGSVLAVYSAVGHWADEVVEELRKTCPDSVIEVVDVHDDDKFKALLAKYLVHESQEKKETV